MKTRATLLREIATLQSRVAPRRNPPGFRRPPTHRAPAGLDAFLDGYVEAALATSTDDHDQPLDRKYDARALTVQTRTKMRNDAIVFLVDNRDDIDGEYEAAGADFWLTRNGTGAGFWDGDWRPDDRGERLTASARGFGEVWLTVSRGKISGH